jgi:hypothetical protein
VHDREFRARSAQGVSHGFGDGGRAVGVRHEKGQLSGLYIQNLIDDTMSRGRHVEFDHGWLPRMISSG